MTDKHSRLREEERLYWREVKKNLRKCKRLHDISRSRPQDEKARRNWMDFANEHILEDSSLDDNEIASASYKNTLERTRLIRKMLIDEDVEAVRRLLKESRETPGSLLNVKSHYGSGEFKIFELALVFDLSIEMIRAIMEEGIINKELYCGKHWWEDWSKDSAYLNASVRCEYKWLLQYLDLLKELGFKFSEVGSFSVGIPVKVVWFHTLTLYGLGVIDWRAEQYYKEFSAIFVLVSAKTVKRVGKNSFLGLLKVDTFRALRAMLLPKDDLDPISEDESDEEM